jgi:hypothetical protein
MTSTFESGDKKQSEWGVGVFNPIVDRRAFLDKVVLSIRGERWQFPTLVRNRINKPIGGPNRNYARSERGVLPGNENPYELQYGVMRLRGVLPSLILVLRSESSPLTPRWE